jgi:potassium-transporting ATPase potassium-binding subunit
MLVFAIIAVFVAGLMIGRTPEYLGKKIEAFEMKMASSVILIPPLLVLAGTAVAVLVGPGKTPTSSTPGRMASARCSTPSRPAITTAAPSLGSPPIRP